ncbi:helix-turn-helix domain-containing protein [Iningainema tapete]|uniref:Transcriptional regulator n=1 Tax=Iningainema tapete BLCC-T55 TaxID=2748662 RepID=A0A8J6XJ88_9CYAN|nr:transcriptional regulator [Iningainema tapete]MBD2771771.1 transcriptional regulator [Iningainema tapete BLCC-T55]
MSITFDKATDGKLLVEIQPKVITSEEEYDSALEATEKLMSCKSRSPEQTAILQLLVTLIEEYETKNYLMGESSPHEIIQHLMEAQEIKQSDLVKILGSLIVVSDIINGTQEISKAQAKVLGEFFHVSPSLFI